ncbi:glycoside hydrolase family 3 N-terminal domain-containing protein [Microbacter sp. GSS18]|nr:glycoside hydrolase family 3 N-terminal domain-containing protein [Microbacter sp. GSS18]
MKRRLREIVVCGVLTAVAAVAVGDGAAWATTAEAATPAMPSVGVVAAPPDAPAASASDLVASLSTRQKAAAVVMGHLPTTDPGALRAYMSDTGIGGFILMGANVPRDESALRAVTRALTPDDALPPLLAIDQEGGDVSRLPWDDFEAATTLKSEPASATRSAFAGRAALVLRAGIGVNFGIVADVTADPGSFIYRRALGTSPETGAERVSAAVDAESGSALSTLKHFPGHGAAPGDSHVGIPSTSMPESAWAGAEAAPFRAGIEAGAPLVMFGHLAYTEVDAAPASLSETWHRIVREDLGFDGVAITDDLGMLEASGIPEYRDPVANAVEALAAGSDMVLTVLYSDASTAPRIVDGIVAAVDDGSLPVERLDEAARRVTTLRLALAAAGEALLPCTDCAAVG